MNPKNSDAFFDFDESLLDIESGRLGFRYLWERRLVSFGFILEILKAFYVNKYWQITFLVSMILSEWQKWRKLNLMPLRERFREGMERGGY